MVSMSSSQKTGADTKKATIEDAALPARKNKARYREPSYISPITIRANENRFVEPLAVEIAEFVERQESEKFSEQLLTNSSELARAKMTRRFDQFWEKSDPLLQRLEPEIEGYIKSLDEHEPNSRKFLRAEIENQAERIILIRAREQVEIQKAPKGGYPERKLTLRGPKPREL